jgi:hypothetical protein
MQLIGIRYARRRPFATVHTSQRLLMEHNVSTQPKFDFNALGDILLEVAHAGAQVLRFAGRTLQRMSWPALLVACVMAAFLLTILPLALMLFAFFLLLKLAVGACFVSGRRRRHGEDAK